MVFFPRQAVGVPNTGSFGPPQLECAGWRVGEVDELFWGTKPEVLWKTRPPRSKGTAHRPVTSSHLPERYFRSLQWFHWDIVFIMKETQPLKPSKPFWERREIWHKCVWFYRVLCCWGHKLTGIIALTGFDFVCLPLVPQLPLSSLLCVLEGWPLVISWCSQPRDPT